MTSDITTEWKKYRQLLLNKLEHSMKPQLKELVTNETMKTLFPKIAKIATISLTIRVSTASIKRSFSKMKLIKTRLRISLTEKTFLTDENFS